MKYTFLVLLPVMLTFSVNLFAQDRTDKNAVTYEQIYDEPYAVNKLFVALQPIYGELFVANVNAGFGAEAHYSGGSSSNQPRHLRAMAAPESAPTSRRCCAPRSERMAAAVVAWQDSSGPRRQTEGT